MTLTWLRGSDERDGTRIDRYSANDGYFYERMVPRGVGYYVDLQGARPGR
jgi:hypothetical protein